MPAYKDRNNTWYVKTYYRDFSGKRQTKTKRGFQTKREARDWETNFLNTAEGSLNMSFEDFVEVYRRNQGPRIKITTSAMKDNVLETKIVPFFSNKSVVEITAIDIIQWQNVMMSTICPSTGKPYSESYLRTMHSQLSAVFNHAVKFYGLKENPAQKAGRIGSDRNTEMLFWTQEEYAAFSEMAMDEPFFFYAFEILYWCGIREGELFALTPADIDFEKGTMRINKTYAFVKGQGHILPPKSSAGNRTIKMPDFLLEEIRDFIDDKEDLKKTDRLFPTNKYALARALERNAKRAGVKVIRIHDLRHSHVSLLINMGYSAVAIARRMGHESIFITYRYAHMFPSEQENMARDLGKMKGGMYGGKQKTEQ